MQWAVKEALFSYAVFEQVRDLRLGRWGRQMKARLWPRSRILLVSPMWSQKSRRHPLPPV